MSIDKKKKGQDKSCLTNEKLEKVSGGEMRIYSWCKKCKKPYEGVGSLCPECKKKEQK